MGERIEGPDGASAVLSEDGTYRYRLTRRVSDRPDPYRLVFVMLNPSTADAFTDDATIRRCVGYAKRRGFDELEVVNLYAYRATDPDDLRRAHASGVDVVGPENLAYVDESLRRGFVAAAWGNNAATCPPTPVSLLLASWSQTIWCLGTTAAGQPRHPSRGPYRRWERWTPLSVTPPGPAT